MGMRQRLDFVRHAGTRCLLPLLVGALLAAKSSVALGACCSDAVPAPRGFSLYGPGGGGAGEVTVGKNESIQNAIGRVRAGGLVRIPAGDYKGNLVIRKPVQLRAQKAGTAVLRATDPKKACIRVDARKGAVRIYGLVIVSPAERDTPCVDVKASAFELSGSTVVGSPDAEGVIVRSRVSFIDRNYIARSKTGILLLSIGTGRHIVSRNDIDDNVEGLAVSAGANVLGSRNFIHRNAGRGIVNINGGGAYSENLIYANGTGIELIYSARHILGLDPVLWIPVSDLASSEYAEVPGLELGTGTWRDSWLSSAERAAMEEELAKKGPAQPGAPPSTAVEPGFSRNVIMRNQGAGVAARGDPPGQTSPAGLRATFASNCVYDNSRARGGRKSAQIEGDEFIRLVGRTNYIGGRGGLFRGGAWGGGGGCSGLAQSYASTAASNMSAVTAWHDRWQEFGLRVEPGLGADWTAR